MWGLSGPLVGPDSHSKFESHPLKLVPLGFVRWVPGPFGLLAARQRPKPEPLNINPTTDRKSRYRLSRPMEQGATYGGGAWNPTGKADAPATSPDAVVRSGLELTFDGAIATYVALRLVAFKPAYPIIVDRKEGLPCEALFLFLAAS